jgi:glycerol uptake facilitator protein
MTPFLAEFIGTALVILLGNGVVANVVLTGTKGNGGGWMVITTAWALAVFVGVVVSAPYSGAHLNPAVTIALAISGKFDVSANLDTVSNERCSSNGNIFRVFVSGNGPCPGSIRSNRGHGSLTAH